MNDKKPLDIAKQLRADGYIDAAECIEMLYRLVIESSVDNMQLREQMTPSDVSGFALQTRLN